jgi:hypothetical protein
MNFIGPLAVIVASLVALSSFIIAKKPEAKQLFDKIAPYQGFLGAGLLLWSLYALYYYVIAGFGGFDKSLFSMAMDGDKLAAISLLGYIVCGILLGFILGFGIIASWIPGESGAEKKGLEIQKKLLAFSLPIGAAGLVFSILWLIKTPPGL